MGWWGQWTGGHSSAWWPWLCFRMLWQAKAGSGYKSYLIKDINGNVFTTEARCLNGWTGNFQQLLNWPPAQVDEDLLNTSSMKTNNNSNSLTSPVTADEVRAAPRSVKNGHALGVCPSLLNSQKLVKKALFSGWFTSSAKFGIHKELLDYSRWGVILPFWKCKGDKLICSNDRGITLFSVLGKLFTCNLLSMGLPAIHSKCQPQT